MKLKTLILLLGVLYFGNANAQYTMSGVVYDSSLLYGVENVKVITSSGAYTYSDSLGKYKIAVAETDSVFFYYLGKPTQKFSVIKIPDISQFDIRLHVNYKGKYKLLKGVTVFSKSYKEKFAENRETYAKVFNYEKPGLHTSMSNGVAGADLDALINIFRFRHNKTMKWFRNKLITEEQEKYIDYRFNKATIKRITQMQGALLDSFIIEYRPNYEFAITADEITFNKYVLACFYQYKMELMKPKEVVAK